MKLQIMVHADKLEKVKLLTIISIIATIFILILLITITIRGYQGLENTSSINQYYIKKYQTAFMSGNYRRYALTAIALSTLIVQNIIIVSTYLGMKNQQQTKIEIFQVCYILISISVIFTIPTMAFYLSLVVELGKQKSYLADKAVILTQSIIALLLLSVCWIIIFKYILEQETPKYGNSDQKQPTDYGKEDKVDRLELLQREIFNPLLFNELQDKDTIERSNLNDIAKVIQLSDRTAFSPKLENNPVNKLMNKIYNNNSVFRSQVRPSKGIPFTRFQQPKKKQQQNQQKQLLKAEIEKKKKKFRELKHRVVYEQSGQYEQSVYQSDDNEIKMNNLPKTYRQYIKQAKKPKRIIKITSELQPHLIQSKLISLIDQQSNIRRLIDDKLTNLIDGQQTDRPKRPKIQRRNGWQVFSKEEKNKIEEELICVKNLKGMQRAKKILFEPTGSYMNEHLDILSNNDDESSSSRPVKIRKIKTKEQELIEMLKKKYNRDEDFQGISVK